MRNILYVIVTLFLVSCNSNSKKKESSKISQNKNHEFVWGFSKKKKFVYSYSHIASVTTKMDKNEPADKLLITSDGSLNVETKGNSLADLSLIDMKIDMIKYNTDGIPEDTKSKKSISYGIIKDMKSNGNFSNPKQLPLFYLFFPLPSKTLKIGDSDKSSIDSNIVTQLTFKGYEMFEGRKCAVLKGNVLMPELEVPEMLKGIYKNSNTGLATYYFDLRERHYIGADVEWSSKSIRVKNPYKNDIDMYYERLGNNLIKIRFEKIEN